MGYRDSVPDQYPAPKLVEELISEGIPFRMRDALPNLYDHWIVRIFLLIFTWPGT